MEALTIQDQSLEKFQTISEIVAKNKPIIAEKIQKAVSIGKMITIVDTDDQAKTANDYLVKCNATIPVIEGLRKEYTSLVDQWKKSEMAGETELKAEMDRVRKLLNDRANRENEANKIKQQAIELTKKKAIEVARVKQAMVDGVARGIAERLKSGEDAIAGMFEKATLETVDQLPAKLDGIKPKLKEDLFDGFLNVTFDKELIGDSEFLEIFKKARAHFDYPKCDQVYCKDVAAIIVRWKEKIPARKTELERISKASAAEAERLKSEAGERAIAEAASRAALLETQDKAIQEKSSQKISEATMDAEFRAQVGNQEIAPLEGVRGVISYRLKDESNAVKVVEALSQVMIHVAADPGFKGWYKRDASGIPKRDDKGNPEYITPIQSWLDLLAKVKPAPDVHGLVKFEDVSAVAKAR